MLTDTHCHLFSSDYYDPMLVINNLNRDNLKRIIINGFNANSNSEVMKLINNCNVFGALGIHPDNIGDFNSENIKFIEENILNDKILAVGEIGLDYYHNDRNKDKQIEMFEYLLNLAERNNLPVIIHCRNASDDMLRILKTHHCKGIIHCFSGSIETAREYVKLGYYLGIGGVLTFKNSKLKDVIKEIGVNHILLETDSPYLTPEPLRGIMNEPVNVNLVFNFLLELFDYEKSELEKILENNYMSLFS